MKDYNKILCSNIKLKKKKKKIIIIIVETIHTLSQISTSNKQVPLNSIKGPIVYKYTTYMKHSKLTIQLSSNKEERKKERKRRLLILLTNTIIISGLVELIEK